MPGLKRLRNPDRHLHPSYTPTSIDFYPLVRDELSDEAAFWEARSAQHSPVLPNMENQPFLKVERQFEELHDYFRSRPGKRYNYIDPKPCPLRTKRHVDVLEAIFSQSGSSVPVSPMTLYNEDIAERNLNSPPPIQVQDPYSRVISALYQEDVADRNIIKNGGLSPRNISHHTLRDRKERDVPQAREACARTRSQSPMANRRYLYESGERSLRTSISEHDLRNQQFATKDRKESDDEGESLTRCLTQETTYGIPRTPSNAGLGNTPGLLPPLSSRPSTSGSCKNGEQRRTDNKSNHAGKSGKSNTEQGAVGKSTSRTQCNLSLFPKPRPFSSRKNVRDLSINMDLAAPRRLYVKMANQPPESAPVPARERNPSIAEVVNSPVSVAPTLPKTPSYGMEEMMNLFKQAYNSIQRKNSQPTFETLQDAIVREINSHDAFRQVHSASTPPRELSPVLIMEYPQGSVAAQVTNKPLGTNFSRKEKYHTAPLRRASQKAKNTTADTPAREISIPAIKGLELDDSYSSELRVRRRRHTYAQPPSGLVHGQKKKHNAQKQISASSCQNQPTDQPNRGGEASDIRPHSSHSRLVRAVAAIRDTSDIPIWSRQPKPINPKVEYHQKSYTTKANENNHIPGSVISSHHTEQRHSAISDGSRSSKSRGSGHPSPNVSDCSSNNTEISTYHSPLEKVRIPLRRGSLQKDLFNSGRFRP